MTTNLSTERKLDDETLAQMHEDASMLAALDEAEDVALDMYQSPFNPETRERALKWLQSQRYESAVAKVHHSDGAADA
ncbi:hypothetical protein [Leifsonia shinshuensis]